MISSFGNANTGSDIEASHLLCQAKIVDATPSALDSGSREVDSTATTEAEPSERQPLSPVAPSSPSGDPSAMQDVQPSVAMDTSVPSPPRLPAAIGGSRPVSRGSDRSRRGRSARANDPYGRRRDLERNLYGNLHVAGIRVISMEGGLGFWFMFTVSMTR